MKALVTLLLLLLAPVLAQSAISVGVSAKAAGRNGGGDVTTSATPVTTQATGSIFLVFFVGGSTIAAPIDNFSNTYTALSVSPVQNTNAGQYLHGYICYTSCAGGSGHFWTTGSAGSFNYQALVAVEIKGGLVSVSPIDGIAGSYFAGAPPINVSITTASSGDLVFAALEDPTYASDTFNPGTGYSTVQSNSSATVAQQMAVSVSASTVSAGTQNPNWSTTGAVGAGASKMVGITVGIKAAGGGVTITLPANVNLMFP